MHEALRLISSHTRVPSILFKNISRVIATALPETQKHKGNRSAAADLLLRGVQKGSHIPHRTCQYCVYTQSAHILHADR